MWLQGVITCVFIVFCWIQGTESLQCYNCRGVTNMDPNNCFKPKRDRTIINECAKGESCEIKIQPLDRRQDVIERGCTNNCDDRSYIWNEDFRVICCNDENLCNKAVVGGTSLTLTLAMAVTLLWLLVKW